ncbi:MAG TPA: hypothetical protein ENI92_06595, partial [Bacteroidetes bacterium]|nr:hypothetical protein [Bacteroidota bacterium]
MNDAPETGFPVRKLLTHAHPDLDACLSAYLLRRHGEELFPGVGRAEVIFTSADRMPENRTALDLEADGVLTVDTGGGRFDTHPTAEEDNAEKWATCAAALVAEALGVRSRPEYRFLLHFVVAHDARGQSLTSRDSAHHLMAPPSLLEGLHRLVGDDGGVLETAMDLIDGLAASARGDEPPLEETAGRFDRTLAAFLEREPVPESGHERKQPDEWPAEGVSHAIAREKGVTLRRDLEKLLRTAARLLAGRAEALPEREEERRMLLPAALDGLARLHGDGGEDYLARALLLVGAAVQRERDWYSALDEVQRSARMVRGRGITLVAIASRNGLVIKAARYRRRADAILYMDPGTGFVTVQAGRKNDGKPTLNLPRIAGRLRIAEQVKREENKLLQNPT